jgi:hypothetical protein
VSGGSGFQALLGEISLKWLIIRLFDGELLIFVMAKSLTEQWYSVTGEMKFSKTGGFS